MKKSFENFVYDSPLTALAVMSIAVLLLIGIGLSLQEVMTNNHGITGEAVICEVYTDVDSFSIERKDIEIRRELPVVEISLPNGRKVTTTNFTMDCQ